MGRAPVRPRPADTAGRRRRHAGAAEVAAPQPGASRDGDPRPRRRPDPREDDRSRAADPRRLDGHRAHAARPGPADTARRARSCWSTAPDSVQTSIRMARPGLLRTDPGYPALALANMIFGGYFSSRWTENLREDKGYTYGPHSRVDQQVLGAVLALDVEVATEVTAPSVLETLYELGRIASLPVKDTEVESVRQYALGTLALRRVDAGRPRLHAVRAGRVRARAGLDRPAHAAAARRSASTTSARRRRSSSPRPGSPRSSSATPRPSVTRSPRWSRSRADVAGRRPRRRTAGRPAARPGDLGPRGTPARRHRVAGGVLGHRAGAAGVTAVGDAGRTPTAAWRCARPPMLRTGRGGCSASSTAPPSSPSPRTHRTTAAGARCATSGCGSGTCRPG